MADPAAVPGSYDVVCPHCGKGFEAELMTAATAPHAQGFKCPHCRLFVPLERAAEAEPAENPD